MAQLHFASYKIVDNDEETGKWWAVYSLKKPLSISNYQTSEKTS